MSSSGWIPSQAVAEVLPGYRAGPVMACRTPWRLAGAQVVPVTLVVDRHEILREHSQRLERFAQLVDRRGAVHAVDLVIDESRVVHLAHADDIGDAPLAPNDGREHAVVARVLELLLDNLAARRTEGFLVHLHEPGLTVVEVRPRVVGVGLHCVAVSDVRIAGGQRPRDMPILCLPQQGPDGEAGGHEVTALEAVLVVRPVIHPDVRIGEQDGFAVPGPRRPHEPAIGRGDGLRRWVTRIQAEGELGSPLGALLRTQLRVVEGPETGARYRDEGLRRRVGRPVRHLISVVRHVALDACDESPVVPLQLRTQPREALFGFLVVPPASEFDVVGKRGIAQQLGAAALRPESRSQHSLQAVLRLRITQAVVARLFRIAVYVRHAPGVAIDSDAAGLGFQILGAARGEQRCECQPGKSATAVRLSSLRHSSLLGRRLRAFRL